MASPLQQIKEVWNRLPMSGRITIIGAAVATIGLMAAVLYYGSQPEYGVLFSDLKPADAQGIVEKLKAGNVPYSLTNNGTTIQVPNERISELRLQMASAGILSGGHVGFDLFDKTNFGATDFAQQVNYRRAIEGELVKTLEGMDEVESARVHITPKKESVFTEKEEGAKASVMLRVRQGKELSNERTDAIVSLISSSVEGLDPSGVSVMDTRGRLLTAGGQGKGGSFSSTGVFNAQLEAKQKMEAETAARVVSLIEPITGEGKVRADVAADVDFSQVEQTEEKYNPESQVVRSQQTSQEARNSGGNNPAGITGARANDPTAQPSAAPAAPSAPNSGDQRSTSTVNYEIDKTVKKTLGAGGRINRMSVSVVLDHKMVNGVQTVRTPEELKQIQDLVAAAVGIDQNRGDNVVVQTMPFDKPEMEAGANAGWLDKYKQYIPSLMKYGTLVAIALLLLLFVIRPAKRALKIAAAPQTIETKLLSASADGTEGSQIGGEFQERRGQISETAVLASGQNASAESAPMMTVAELEAQMQAELERESVNTQAQRAETLKKMLAEQTLREPEVVVSTLRGWLREHE